MIEQLEHDSLVDENIRTSEVRYRRLFETAQDAIFILNGDSGKITDANPYISRLLGYSHDEFVGKELWEIGLFRDIEANRAAYRELKRTGYIRYDYLPLHTKDERQVEVEFVSSVYEVDGETVIQCNIRDTTERSRLERQTQEQAIVLADISRRKDEFLALPLLIGRPSCCSTSVYREWMAMRWRGSCGRPQSLRTSGSSP